jgi:hypothetical protein
MMDSSVHKQLHFKSVNAENRREVEGLTVFSEQAGFIESVSEWRQMNWSCGGLLVFMTATR